MADLALRAADVTLLLLLAGLVAQSRRRDHTPWVGVALALSIASFVATSAPGARGVLGPVVVPLTALCVAKPVLLWLLARGLFADRFHLGPADWAALALMTSAGLGHELALDPSAPGALALSLAYKAATLAFVAAGPAAVLRGRVGDLEERRRRWRLRFVVAASSYIAAVVAVQATTVLQGARTPDPLVTANLAFVAAGALAAIVTLVQIRPLSWLEAPAPAVDALPPEDAGLIARIQHAFATERIWREPGLTIRALAERLRAPEHAVRRAINQGLGFRNFNDFLHAFRLEEACRRLRTEPDTAITSIALDAGYASLGPFNRAFKERTGMTPSAFRRADSEIGARTRGDRPALPRPTA